MTADAHFHKYEALGNDMLVVDPARFPLPLNPPRIRALCDRHTGPGADGICTGPLPGPATCFTMRFFNPDGSEAEKSGNGLRIFARYLWDAGLAAGESCTIAMNNEPLRARKLDPDGREIEMEMGRLQCRPVQVPVDGTVVAATAVSIGNPHCVLPHDDLTQIHRIGPQLETAPQFPGRTNVQLLQILNRRRIRISIWERGAGYTRASGSSACAAAGTAVYHGRCAGPVTVEMDGGTAVVAIDTHWQARLTGAVRAVYNGRLAEEFVARLEALDIEG